MASKNLHETNPRGNRTDHIRLHLKLRTLRLQGFRGKNITEKWFLLVCGWLLPSCFLSGRWFMVIRHFSPIPSQSSAGSKVLPGISWPFPCSSLLIYLREVHVVAHKASGFESIIPLTIWKAWLTTEIYSMIHKKNVSFCIGVGLPTTCKPVNHDLLKGYTVRHFLYKIRKATGVRKTILN